MHVRSSTGLILWVVALCALGTQGQAVAQGKPQRSIRVHVDSVLATDTHKGMDARLAATSVGDRLRAVFDYTTYRLLKQDEEETIYGQAVAFNLPGGRILHVAPLEVEGNMIAMELVLFEGAHLIMRTELKMLMNRGALILVGPRSLHETYITTIAAETGKELPEETTPPEIAVMPGAATPAGLPSTAPNGP